MVRKPQPKQTPTEMSRIVETITDIRQAGYFPICNICKNHISGLKCEAFDIIPDEIIYGDNDHSVVLPNQNNLIIFEPINKNQ